MARRASSRSRTPADDYDGPWKEALERYFPAFLAFFFPVAYADIDWTRGYVFLDKELQQVTRRTGARPRHVDKLVRVWRKDGEEAWVLVHVEIQSQADTGFAERMWVYNTRLYDRYRRVIVSLGVLADERADWRPDQFTYELWGCAVSIRYPVVKLLDYEARWEELEQSRNPFAAVVMAHLKTQATRHNPETRYEWKLRITTRLFEVGFTPDDVAELFRVIDWMMALPEGLEQRFDADIEEFEAEGKMTYITRFERRGIRKGELQEARDALLDFLEARFRELPQALRDVLGAIEDVDRLRALRPHAATAPSLEEFRRLMADPE